MRSHAVGRVVNDGVRSRTCQVHDVCACNFATVTTALQLRRLRFIFYKRQTRLYVYRTVLGHCAKALRLGRLWKSDKFPSAAAVAAFDCSVVRTVRSKMDVEEEINTSNTWCVVITMKTLSATARPASGDGRCCLTDNFKESVTHYHCDHARQKLFLNIYSCS